jgi:hypothetical protein
MEAEPVHCLHLFAPPLYRPSPCPFLILISASMSFQSPQNINAPGGAFNHVLGNQYNISTTNHAVALHSPPSPHVPEFDSNQVSVPTELRYYHDREHATRKVVLLDAKMQQSDWNEETSDLNESIRIKLGEWDFNLWAIHTGTQHFLCLRCEGVPADYYVAIEFDQVKPKVLVTREQSCYDAQSRSGLCIPLCVQVTYLSDTFLIFLLQERKHLQSISKHIEHTINFSTARNLQLAEFACAITKNHVLKLVPHH